MTKFTQHSTNLYWPLAAIAVISAILAGCSTPAKHAAMELQAVHANYNMAKRDPGVAKYQQASDILADAANTIAVADHKLDMVTFDDDNAIPVSTADEVEHLAYIAQQQIDLAHATADNKEAELTLARLENEREQALMARRRVIDEELNAALARAEADGAEVIREGNQIKIVFRDITFELNKSDIKPVFQQDLDRLADALIHRYPAAQLKVEGYADITGPDKFNEFLSEQRAISVKTFLIDQGMDPSRVASEGMGTRNPVATNETMEGRAQNRRVELIVTGSDEPEF